MNITDLATAPVELCAELSCATHIVPGNKHSVLTTSCNNVFSKPTLCLATKIVPLIMLGNQQFASLYTWQPTSCLSLYLETNSLPFKMLGNQHFASHYTWQPTLCL